MKNIKTLIFFIFFSFSFTGLYSLNWGLMNWTGNCWFTSFMQCMSQARELNEELRKSPLAQARGDNWVKNYLRAVDAIVVNDKDLEKVIGASDGTVSKDGCSYYPYTAKLKKCIEVKRIPPSGGFLEVEEQNTFFEIMDITKSAKMCYGVRAHEEQCFNSINGCWCPRTPDLLFKINFAGPLSFVKTGELLGENGRYDRGQRFFVANMKAFHVNCMNWLKPASQPEIKNFDDWIANRGKTQDCAMVSDQFVTNLLELFGVEKYLVENISGNFSGKFRGLTLAGRRFYCDGPLTNDCLKTFPDDIKILIVNFSEEVGARLSIPSGKDTSYRPFAFIVRSGMTAGHYWAFAKDNREIWYRYDDEIVCSVPNSVIENILATGEDTNAWYGRDGETVMQKWRGETFIPLVFYRRITPVSSASDDVLIRALTCLKNKLLALAGALVHPVAVARGPSGHKLRRR